MGQINTFLIGAQKAGTTSLYDWLAQHPDIFAPKTTKDLHFFSHPDHLATVDESVANFYKQKQATKISLHGAVNYLFFPEVAQRLYDYNANAKIIIILRHPIERAFSAHRYFTELGSETRTFKQAITDELAGKNSSHEELANFTYLAHSAYTKQIKKYYSFFEKEKIHILFFEELMQDRRKVISTLFDFLEIDSTFTPDWTHKNKSSQPRFSFLNRLLVTDSKFKKNIKKIMPYQKIIPISWRIKMVNSIRKINALKKQNKIPNSEYQLSAQQEAELKEDVATLSILLNKDLFTLWSFPKA